MKTGLKDTLLLVGDSSSDRPQLHTILESEYNLLEAESASQGILLLRQNESCIAMVLTDIRLTEDSGLKELIDICNNSLDTDIPVICLVNSTGTGQREETAFLLGATDVVVKPYTANSIRRRVDILADLYRHRWNLESLVNDQSRAIRNNNQTMVDTLSSIIEYRSAESGNHTLRIRRFAKLLLTEVASYCPEYGLTEDEIDRISSASALHDIGKITVPDNILNKPEPLSKEEFDIMKTHTTYGAKLIENIGDIGDPLYVRYIYNIVLYHHERWTGKGYPMGLAGQDIPMCAHVVGLVDAYDALTTPRVYKAAFSHEAAVNMILNGDCGEFSPRLLECFKHVEKDFKELAALYADGYSPRSDDIRVPLPSAEKANHEISAIQLSQLKYRSILMHLNDTVVEIDVDNQTYHVVYNPNPDFVNIFADAGFDEMSRQLMRDGVHPENTTNMMEMRRQIREQLFGENKRKVSFRCKIYSHIFEEYHPYEITLLKLNAPRRDQRQIIAIFHCMDSDTVSDTSEQFTQHEPSPSVFGLLSGALCCRFEDGFPIDHGAGSLLTTTGFTADEIQYEFGGSLLNLIVPEDRENLTSMLYSAKNNSRIADCQCRIICKGCEPLWVLGKFRMAIDADGRDVFYILFMDISSIKEREEKLLGETRFHKSLAKLSTGVLLEYNVKTKALTRGEHWDEHFGYPLQRSIMQLSGETMPHVHPDDMPLIMRIRRDIFANKDSSSADVRIADITGRYIWCRVRCTSTFDKDGSPEILTAIIYDINDLKEDALRQKKKAEYDALTGLLNKESAEYSISEYLRDRAPDSTAGLLILDLDNFKSVNDTLGHMYGDSVLKQIGQTLKTLFRPQDIMGRIGGDEFLVLMKDVPGSDLVKDRCQLIVETMENMLHKLMPKLSVSISVGVSIAPIHGTNYRSLFANADNALYTAKRNGKNQFHLYDAKDDYASLTNALPLTRIDSTDTSAGDDGAFVRLVFRKLYESLDINATINELLALIGSRFNVSRVYIFENSDDNSACSNTFEWCNEGIEPQIEFLQNLNYETDLAGFKESYNSNGILYCPDISEMEPNIRDILEPQGIKSLLHCAILDRGVFRGYIGFDECTANYLWTQDQISLLQYMAEVLAVFLIKQRSTENKENDN